MMGPASLRDGMRMAKPSCKTEGDEEEEGLALATGLCGGSQGPAPTDLLNLGMLRGYMSKGRDPEHARAPPLVAPL